MAAQRSSLKRKPLSDCTNTIAARTNAVRRKSSLRSALTQPPESFSENDSEAPLGSLKSNTSTGSNNPPISTSARSAILTASQGSENAETKKRKDKGKAVAEETVVKLALDVSENEETRRRKDKGEAVDEYAVAQSALDGRENKEANRRKEKGKALVEDTVAQFALDGRENEEEKRRKDKGKAVVEDTGVQFDPVSPLTIKLSSSTVPDGRENLETKKRKDKGKAVLEDTLVQLDPVSPSTMKLSSATVPDLSRSRTVYTRKRVPEPRNLRSLKIAEPVSCPPLKRLKDKGKQIGVGGRDEKSGMHRHSLSDGRENEETRRRKDKGKAIVEYAVAQSASDGRENEEANRRKEKGKALVEDTVAQIALDGRENEEEKRRKDKGKAVVEDTVVQFDPVSPLTIKLSSATVPDGRENRETKKRKDKGKAVLEDTLVQLDPVSPSTMNLSSATVTDISRSRTVYTQKRVPEPKNLRSLKIAEPVSCPPLKRLKDKGKQIDVGGRDEKSAMHRHSLSAPKKLSRGKSKQKVPVDTMPKEEVEKLRAYYADIDAFELPVEEANDSD